MQNNTLKFLFFQKKSLILSLLLLCFSINNNAQNLISNGNFDLGNNVGFQNNGSGYNLVSGTSGSSNSGDFAFIASQKPMNTGTFLDGTDHTGGGGKMYVIDGNTTGGGQSFYKAGTNGGGICSLTVGAKYTFSYFIKSVSTTVTNSSTQADIKVKFNNISGGEAGTLVTGSTKAPIPSGDGNKWIMVSYEIYPTNQCVNIEMFNDNTNPVGNDFAIDDVSLFGPPQPLTISSSSIDPFCPSSNDGTIVAYPNGGTGPTFTYELKLGSTFVATNTTGVFTGLSAGTNYTVKVTDSNSSPKTATTGSINLTNPPDLTVSASPTGCILPGAAVTLTAANGGATYGWSASPGGAISSTSNSISVNPSVTTTYTVTSATVYPATANLIGNPGFENGTSGFFSDYVYTSGLNTGGSQFKYGIVNSPYDFYNVSPGAFINKGDHTTGSGKMFVADGATSAGSIVWSQAIPVENNKTYNFEFWALNAVSNNLATFQVKINGVAITLSPNPPSASGTSWTKISGTWNSGTTNPIATIQIIDTNTASGGNDFAIDDILFNTSTPKTCNLSKQITVNVSPILTPIISCGTITLTSVQFTWAAVTGATGYTVSYVKNSQPAVNVGAIGNVLSHTVNGLTSGDSVVITLTPTGGSGTCFASNTQTCIPSNCVAPTITGTLNVCAGLTTQLSGSGTANSSNPWVSSAPSIATVSGTGLVTGVAAGTSTITYKDDLGCTTTATVTVNALPTITGTLNVCAGLTTPLTGSGTANVSNPWVSASPAIATVDNLGVVTGVAAGTSTITYKNNNGCIITTVVTVNALPTITGTLDVCAGLTTPLTGSGTPNGTTPWVSASTAIATVSNTGVVTGVSAGTSLITYKNNNGCIITATVTVNALPTITGTLNVCVGLTTALTGSGTANVSNPWVSSAPAIATVSNTGVVTGVAPGNTTITYKNNNGCIITANVAVNALPTLTGVLNICLGSPTTLTGSGTPNAVNPWVSVSPAIATVSNTGVVTSVATGTTDIIYKNNNGCIISTTVTVNSIPALTITCGTITSNSVQFNWNSIADATSYDYSYKINSGAPVTGNLSAATTTFTLNTLTPGQTVDITVTPVGSLCGTSGSGSCASLNCIPPTVTPVSNSAFCANETVPTQIFVSNPPSGTTIKWKTNNTAIGSIATNGIGSIPSFTAANVLTQQIATITVTAEDAFCISSEMIYTITVNPLPLVPTITTVAPTCSADGNSTMTNYSALNTYTFLPTGPTVGTGGLISGMIIGTPYTVTSNNGNCTSLVSNTFSNSAMLITPAIPVISMVVPTCSTNGTSTISNYSTSNTYTFTPSGPTVSVGGLINGMTIGLPYKVNSKSGSCTSPDSASFSNAAGIIPTNPVFTQVSPICEGSTPVVLPTTSNNGITGTWGPTSNSLVTTVYTFTPNPTECAISMQMTIIVKKTPVVTATPNSQTICSGEYSSIVLKSSIPNTTTFNWTATSSGATGASAGSGSVIAQVLTATGITVGSVDYTVTPTANGCSGTPIVVNILVSPFPTVTAIPTATICSGDSTSIGLTSNVAGSTFSWNAVQTNVTGASANSGNTISQTLTTTGNQAGEAAYSVVPTANGCPGLPTLITVTVNPIPVATVVPALTSICSGTATNIALSSIVGGTTFSWTANPSGVLGSFAGTGKSIIQTLKTNDVVPGTVDYTVTPIANGCSGLTVMTTITVKPTPEVFGSGGAPICSGDTTNITLSPNIPGTVFNWTVAQNKVFGATDGSGDQINQILETQNATNQGVVTYTITPTLDGCDGNSIGIVVNVNPLPLPLLKDAIICVEQASGIPFSTGELDSGLSSATHDFEWYYEGVKIDGAAGDTYEASQLGIHSVIATNTTSSCVSHESFANVSAIYPVQSFIATVSDAFTPNPNIVVSVYGGTGKLVYQLDQLDFQSSNVFSGVSSGTHTVRVNDTQGCTNLSQTITVIDYPKYFTPNGDGFNDTWKIVGLENQPMATIFIYDRYGKLIKQISTLGNGWDGTFNGFELPATDYWFTVEFLENNVNRVFRSHFSLKR